MMTVIEDAFKNQRETLKPDFAVILPAAGTWQKNKVITRSNGQLISPCSGVVVYVGKLINPSVNPSQEQNILLIRHGPVLIGLLGFAKTPCEIGDTLKSGDYLGSMPETSLDETDKTNFYHWAKPQTLEVIAFQNGHYVDFNTFSRKSL